MSSGNGILNQHAYDITAKVLHKIKYLDGGFSLTIRVKTWEGGEPYYRDVDLGVDYKDKAKAVVTEVANGPRR